MTLALYGKSRKRQGGLALAALIAVMMAALAGLATLTSVFAHHLVLTQQAPTCGNNLAWNLVVSEGSWSSYREAVPSNITGSTPVALRFDPYIDNGTGSTTILSANGTGVVHTAGTMKLYTGSFAAAGNTDTSSTDINSSTTSLVHSGGTAWNANFIAGKVILWDSELMKITARSADGKTLT